LYVEIFIIVSFFLSSLVGNILSSINHEYAIGVGASTTGFGIFALYGCYLAKEYNNLGARRNRLLAFYVILLGKIHQINN